MDLVQSYNILIFVSAIFIACFGCRVRLNAPSYLENVYVMVIKLVTILFLFLSVVLLLLEKPSFVRKDLIKLQYFLL